MTSTSHLDIYCLHSSDFGDNNQHLQPWATS
jgi:hypothetical protein